MSSWSGTARSNYVGVKDTEAFKAWGATRDLTLIEKDGKFAIISNSEYGWPSFSNEDDHEIDISSEFCQHLSDGEIVVMIEAGAEGARYLTGIAEAVHSDGRSVRVTLDDIYMKAAIEFGVPLTSINPAEY
jgi:hypothetical protein